MKTHWLVLSLLAAACAGAAARPIVFPQANAAGAQHCDWRYITDQAYPEIPKGMEQTLMSEQWAALGAAGYHLVVGHGAYIFERCISMQ